MAAINDAGIACWGIHHYL